MKNMEPVMKAAVILNITGVSLLALSLLAWTPFQLTLTMAAGGVLAFAGFGLWVKMVIDEALRRGMLE